jgi:hypothetical protein
MKDEDFLKLKSKEREQLITYNESLAHLREAEAHLENQKKWRIVFERAPKETIPFIIYCVEVVLMSLIGLFKVIDLEGDKLYIGSVIIFCALFFPLLVLPGKSWHDLWNWIKVDILKRGAIKRQNRID